ncbi:MAG: BlaI/MecI/CopY family transcriptional regulator [Vicinamibacterales bacterium]
MPSSASFAGGDPQPAAALARSDMARRRSVTLTDGETRLMHVLWERGAATVAEVVRGLPGRPRPSYTSVQTLLRILETKGFVAHDKSGRRFVYRPVVERAEARRHALRHLLSRLFDNSPSLLILNVLEDEQIDAAELARLRTAIDQA